MAIYFPNQVPSTGQKAGEAFAGGIGNVLNQLANQKISQFQQRQQAQKMGSVFQALGLPAEIGQLPENLQQVFLKQHLAQPQQQALADVIGSLFGGGEQAQQQQPSQPDMNQEQMMLQTPAAPQQPSQGPMTQQDALTSAMQGGLQPERIMQQKGPSQEQLRKLSPQQLTQVAGLGLQQKKIEQSQKNLEKKIEAVENKDRRSYTTELIKEKRVNDDRLAAIKVMKKLNDTPGALDSPLYIKALRAFGINDIGSLLKPGTAQFNASQVAFLTGLKTIFGARPTNFDVGTYLNKLPDIMQSAEGRRRVLASWEKLLEGAQARYNITRDILKENPRGLPADIELMIEDRSAPILDKIAQEFEKEAIAMASGMPQFSVGQTISESDLKSLPPGTVIETSDGSFIWDGSKKKRVRQ